MSDTVLIVMALIVGAFVGLVVGWAIGRRDRRTINTREIQDRLAGERARSEIQIHRDAALSDRHSANHYRDCMTRERALRIEAQVELEPFQRLRDRLGLVKTMDDEWAVPNLDRLWSVDFPNPQPLTPDGIIKWSPIWTDKRNAASCYLHEERARSERDRIMREEKPTPVSTRWREARYPPTPEHPDGRVVRFHMDRPDTWPPEIRQIGDRAREALPAGFALPVVDFAAMKAELDESVRVASRYMLPGEDASR